MILGLGLGVCGCCIYRVRCMWVLYLNWICGVLKVPCAAGPGTGGCAGTTQRQGLRPNSTVPTTSRTLILTVSAPSVPNVPERPCHWVSRSQTQLCITHIHNAEVVFLRLTKGGNVSSSTRATLNLAICIPREAAVYTISPKCRHNVGLRN